MRVQVAYYVPVEVVVDTEEETVEKVVVINEGIRYDGSEGVREETTLAPVSDEIASKGLRIAEDSDIDWPVWDHGF